MEGTASSISITAGTEEGEEAAATPTPTFSRCKKKGRSPLSHFRQSEVWLSRGHLADDEVVSRADWGFCMSEVECWRDLGLCPLSNRDLRTLVQVPNVKSPAVGAGTP